mgnify:CR=1 FL=1
MLLRMRLWCGIGRRAVGDRAARETRDRGEGSDDRGLISVLKAAGIQQDMSFITRQIGMFSYSGLSKDQMLRLRSEFGVYGTDTGRMCVAALNSQNIGHVCNAIASVLK